MRLKREHVHARCLERGYSIESAEPCFISDLGDGWWEVDTDHPAYPKRKDGEPAIVQNVPCGSCGGKSLTDLRSDPAAMEAALRGE